MTNPMVSVCIPTYRGASVLADTINSVLSQTYPHFELVIVNDNSPDNTDDIVASYNDPRIRYARNETNLGPQENWNKCLELAQGKYFKLLPHDDLLEADCLEKQVSLLEEDTAKEIALVFGSRAILDPQGRVFMTRGLPRTKPGRIDKHALIQRCIRAGTNLIGEPGNGLFRRELVSKVGGYDATYPYLVDLDYWFRVLLHGDAFYTSKRSSSFRVTQSSWSVAIGGKQYSNFKGFVEKYYSDKKFGITKLDKMIGFVKAKINTVTRGLIYHYLFRKSHGTSKY